MSSEALLCLLRSPGNIQHGARESFHSNLTGMHVCTCREYKACENLSLVALASAIYKASMASRNPAEGFFRGKWKAIREVSVLVEYFFSICINAYETYNEKEQGLK